jgi:hypothetical protein
MKEGTIDDAVAIEGGGVSANGAAPDRLRALFFVRRDDRDSRFVSLASAMLESDHEVVIAFDHKRDKVPPSQARALDSLSARYPGFDHLRLEARRGLWRIPAGATRRGLDYLRYLESGREDAEAVRDAARERAPRLLRALLFLPPFRWRFGRRMLGWMMRRLEAGMPIPRATKVLIRERAPDVVVVSPHAELGSPEAEFIRSASATKTPSVLVMSPGDLSDASEIRDVPTLTIAADQEGVNAAVETYGVPRDRIQAVGVESSDGAETHAPSATVEAIDGAARTEKVPGPPGRILRPILWLLTPLLVIALLLLHPRTTAREGISAMGRLRRRIHTRGRLVRKSGAEKRKERAQSAKEEKRARTEAGKQRKIGRAEEKRRKREHREAVKRGVRARGKSAGQKDQGPANEEKETSEAGG